MKKITIIMLIIISSLQINAQDYKHEVGFRSGYPFGVSYKNYATEENATEFILSYRQRGVQLTALFEKITPLELRYLDNLYFYTGMGAHIGYTSKRKNDIFDSPLVKYYPYEDEFRPVLGMDGIFGIEYRLYTVPLSFSLDIKPYFEIFGQPFFDLSLWDTNFSIKYRFN